MRFLVKWLKPFILSIIKLIRGGKVKKVIPDNISANELLIRGIFTPLFYSTSKQKLKEGAFLPPPNKNDVSILRHDYSNDNACKNHCLRVNIKDNLYCGLSTFLASHISELSIKYEIKNAVYLRYTPLEDDFNTQIEKRPVYTTDRGVPMHADIYYEGEFEAYKPQTKFRRFAKDLAQNISIYFADPNPLLQSWSGEKLSWNSNNISNNK